MLYTTQNGLFGNGSPVLLIVIGIAVMLSLAAAIVAFAIFYQRKINLIQHQKERELTEATIKAEENERGRIAIELHDDVGTTLASVRLFLHAATMENADAAIITQSKELLDESISKVRSISHRLQPALLQQLGLQAALESFAAMISKPGLVKMTCSGETLPRFNDSVELSVYRVVQELTNNIIRHGNATHIAMDTLLLPAHLQVSMVHNGDGLTEETFHEELYKKGAIGLKNIMSRLKSIDADIEFERTLQETFSVNIIIPISK